MPYIRSRSSGTSSLVQVKPNPWGTFPIPPMDTRQRCRHALPSVVSDFDLRAALSDNSLNLRPRLRGPDRGVSRRRHRNQRSRSVSTRSSSRRRMTGQSRRQFQLRPAKKHEDPPVEFGEVVKAFPLTSHGLGLLPSASPHPVFRHTSLQTSSRLPHDGRVTALNAAPVSPVRLYPHHAQARADH